MDGSRNSNPFTPAFGSTPPVLAGRGGVLDRFAEAVETGPTHPDYTLLVTGERGSGKTALLNALEADAAEQGWHIVALASASAPVSIRIADRAAALLRNLHRNDRARIASVNVLGVGIDWERPEDGRRDAPDLTTALRELGEMLRELGTGLLLTIDELHDVERDDMRDVAAAIQMVTRRRLCPVAFAGAALPLIAHTHLADVGMTFFQRCARAPLSPLSVADTRRALDEPITAAGAAIDTDALDAAADATMGYPYMIQLVGYHAWRLHDDSTAPVSIRAVRAAVLEAERTMIEQIAGPIWTRLSPMDKRFLAAMLDDSHDSSVDDIARRIGRSVPYARTYRARLVDAGALNTAGRGRVRYRHHAMRACVEARQHDDLDLLTQ